MFTAKLGRFKDFELVNSDRVEPPVLLPAHRYPFEL